MDRGQFLPSSYKNTESNKALVVVTTTRATAPNLSLDQLCKVMLHMFPEATKQSKFVTGGIERQKLILPIGAESVLLNNLDLIPNLEVQFEPLP
jgi:hypothetical protein